MDVVQLDRFILGPLLGSGSDYEVHGARDSESGKHVVIKRPNPDYIARRLHQSIERVSEQLVELHGSVDGSAPHLAHLVGYTDVMQHDGYFGDSFDREYRVLVEERASGLPLVADIRDKFKGVPIGLAQNLFALHQLIPYPGMGYFSVQQQIMEVEQAFHDSGHLLLDLRPQNIYFDPRRCEITVIDIGTVPTQGPDAQGRAGTGGQPRDLHNFFAEMFQFYATPDGPPSDVEGYGEPAGMRNMPDFTRHLDTMIRGFARAQNPVQEAAVAILQRVRDRAYSSIEEFRTEFCEYLEATRDERERHPDHGGLVDVWRQASERLEGEYWKRFLFDPTADLEPYRAESL